ncbi:glycosyltransferase family 4 protein [bacterium]|nr:glycosyltransferase family 4 protein [bacterium]
MVPLKILFVIDSLGRSGSERSLAELLPYLERASISCIIVCLRQREEGVQKEVEKLGFDVRILKGKGWLSRLRELRKIILAEKPDLIHTTLFASNILGRLSGRGVPILSSLVNTPYEAIRFKDPNIKARRLRIVRWVDSWTARCCTTHFHAVSKAAKESAVTTLGIRPERITVVERGRDPDRLGYPGKERSMLARTALGLDENDEIIVNIGRLEYQKGQKYLLDAIAHLLPKHPRLVLLIAGRSGVLSSELSQLSEKLGLNGRVRFLGYRSDIPEILAAADVFAFPSLYEGLPGAVIEAMALGLPVVASSIPAVLEVVEPGGNALLVQPGSAIEFAQALETLLEDRNKCITFGKRSREIFEERFTLDRSASSMIQLFRQTAATRK